MKLLILAIAVPLFLFLCCTNRASSNTASVKTNAIKTDSLVFHDTFYHDTFFIYRYLDSEWYQADYLIKDKENSDDFKQLMNFNLDSDDNKNLAQDCKYESGSTPFQIKKFDLLGLPNDWLPLEQYKNKYYLWDGFDKRILTDSILIFNTQDGYHSVILQSLTKPNPNKYTLHYKGSINGSTKNNIEGFINIYLLNPKTMLAVWENIEENIHKYELRTSKENANNYDLIGEKSDGETDDHIFEKINFKKLIKESQSQK